MTNDRFSAIPCIVVAGASGAGKSVLGERLAAALHGEYADGDDFHPAANVAAMSAGIPLTDEDRAPWLVAIGRWIDSRRGEHPAVVSCSALSRRYRDKLRHGRNQVSFCCLDVPRDVLERRLAARTDHFMSPSLLASQLALLEPLGADEPGAVVDGTGSPAAVLARALAALGLAPAAVELRQRSAQADRPT